MAPEDVRRNAHELLDGDLEQTLPGVWGKSLNSEDVKRREKRASHIRGSGRAPTFFLHRFPLPKAI